jgi:curved DNA-binding protein CbpA
MPSPIGIKLRCASWQQLASIYKKDLSRSAMFLRSQSPPQIGTPVRIDLTLPSESMVVLTGTIVKHVADGEMAGRGAGVDVRLNPIPQSAMWLIETALASAQKERPRAAAPVRAVSTVSPVPDRDPGLGDGTEVTAAETELIAALTSELAALRRLNPFQILGVGYDTDDAQVRTAFGELTKRYHPDRYARFVSSELRHLAAEIFIVIRDAYRRLGDAASRAQLLAQRARKVVIPPAAPARAAPTAPAVRPPSEPPAPARHATTTGGDVSMGESMLDGGNYDEALSYFKLLVRKSPNDRQARAGIELAEGLRALAARDRLEAAQRFEAALELDPANERAARELAEMRRLATNERRGMLSRLLGKRE